MVNNRMRYLSLFSGIEAATVGWHKLGWEPVAFSEIAPAACSVLSHHYPHVPNLGDVTKITEEQIKSLGQIDLIVFGSPCQNLSLAGTRTGLQGDMSGLFYDAIRIIGWAKKHNKLRFALWENVYGSFSCSEGRDFAAVVEQLAGCRDVTVPKNGWGNEGCAVGDAAMLEWSCLDSQWFGVAQRRRRVFALADFGDWTSRPPVLLERRSLRGNTPPSRETPEIAADLTASGVGTCGADDNQAQANHLVPCRMLAFGEYAVDETASTMKERDYKDATDIVISANYAVRRLTPVECARLQGFPDDYLNVQHARKPLSNSAKYSLLGNSMTTNVMAYIGRQIQNAIGETNGKASTKGV